MPTSSFTSKTRDGKFYGQRASVKSSSIVPDEGLWPKRRTVLFNFLQKFSKTLGEIVSIVCLIFCVTRLRVFLSRLLHLLNEEESKESIGV